ncbi:MAG: SpoIIE family protein phosphatase, partial [Firmicutes bacterium]|nr:SpoIIE family protein phosphatase [Bacillota bacterium]
NLKFATRLLLVILAISLASTMIVSTIAYTELLNLSGYSQDVNTQLGFYASDSSKTALVEQAEAFMTRLAASQAAECDATLAKIQGDVTQMAAFMNELYRNPDNFLGRRLPLPNEVSPDYATAKMMVAPDVVITPEIEREMLLISNAEYVFSNIFAGNPNLSNAYLGSVSGINFRWSISNAFNPEFDPRVRPWFLAARDAEGPVWLDAHVDAFGYILTTCAAAYTGADGRVAGVVASDIHLSTMVENILNMRIGETGYAFLLDNNGHYLAHPHFDELDPNALDAASGEYREVIENMAAGQSGVRQAESNGVEYYIAYAPLQTTGWSLGIAVERDEIISGALQMKENIDRQALTVKDQIRDTLNSVMFRFIVLTCIIIIIVLVLSILISGSVTRPMVKLTEGVIEVGKGNLDNKIGVKAGGEIGVLATCFNKMIDDLKVHIANLSRVTAEKERVSAELDVARRIQAGMLPSIYPSFPEKAEFDLCASMQPARETGGDFYDFFMVDKTTLAVVIAEVSGKGIPAALFMLIAKTLIKNNAQGGKSPKEVLETVNNLLCESNEARMLVTAFLGYLAIPSGKFTFVNAGHKPPLLRAGANFDWLNPKDEAVLAEKKNTHYTQYEAGLKPGDELLFYTDGVTKTTNPDNELFGDSRLLAAANQRLDLPTNEFTVFLKNEIDQFADGSDHADDITLLALRYKGSPTRRI